MTDRGRANGSGIGDVVELVKAYAKQETVDPLRGLGRYIALGIVGSVCLGIGCIFLALAMLRALQNAAAPHFDGHLSWLPYLFTLLATLIVIALAVSRIGRAGQRDRKERR